MEDPTKSQHRHWRNVQLLIILLLALSCLGFFIEMRAEATRRAQLPVSQGVLSKEDAALGLTGGRTRGGSFNRPSAPSGSTGGTIPRIDPGYDRYPRNDGYYPGPSYPSYPSYPGGRTVIIPAPYPGYVPSYPAPGVSTDVGFLILLAVLGFAVLPLLLNLLKLRGGSDASHSGGTSERLNDVITVTQLQVALLAQARMIQSELNELATSANLESQEGLCGQLQQTVLALLRSPENWSHARIASQTVPSREQASQRFEQLSIAERSKITRETLVNVSGNIRRQTFTPREDVDPATYIVVTLLIGTADDRPLVSAQIYSAEDLRTALQRLGVITPDYLLVYELLWTPQDETDSLSRDQLVEAYPDLTQIT